MPEITVEIEVQCSCGNGLCNQATGSHCRRGPIFTVEPCQRCLEAMRGEAYADGETVAEERTKKEISALEDEIYKLNQYIDDLEKKMKCPVCENKEGKNE